jgi:hypothetical protein
LHFVFCLGKSDGQFYTAIHARQAGKSPEWAGAGRRKTFNFQPSTLNGNICYPGVALDWLFDVEC